MSNKANQESICTNGTLNILQSPQGAENRAGTQTLVDTSAEQKGRDLYIQAESCHDRTYALRMQQAAPKAVPAPLSDDVVKDAARYRWLRENWFTMTSNYQWGIAFKVGEPRWSDITEEELDAAIDAIAAQGGKT